MSNIRAVCNEHAPKPQDMSKVPVEALIGKYVKIGFPIDERVICAGGPTLEHMWIKVEGAADDGCELRGTLNNHPQFVNYRLGDTITFDRDEIEDIFKEGEA